MKERYNIQFNRPEPTSEEIKQFQDFDQLLKDFAAQDPEQRSGTVPSVTIPDRSTKVISIWRKLTPYGVAAAAVVAFLIWGLPLLDTSNPVIDEQTYFASQPFINPPATANVPDLIAETVLDPEVDQEIPLDDGELVLSHTALFRDRASAIRRPVEVHYRQMDEVADYFLAGLPLAFEENGQLKQLDAAVVLDVYATAAGEPVSIDPSASVAVHLGTKIQLDQQLANYRLYRLDTVSRSWQDAGPVKMEVAEQNWPEEWPVVQQYRQLEKDYANRLRLAQAESNIQLPNRPEKPTREAGDNPTIELNFLDELALAAGSDVGPEDLDRLNSRGIWEMLPETGEIDLRAFNVIWEEVRLRRLGQNDRYELTLINPAKQEKLIIRPILLDDSNYRAAMERYRAELAEYEKAVAALEAESPVNIEQIESERDAALASAEADIQAYVQSLSPAEQTAFQQRRVDFRFEISNWGLYTVAKVVEDLPLMQEVSYLETVEGMISPQSIYLTDGKHKTLYRGLAQPQGSKLPIGATSSVWLVDEQGKLSIGDLKEQAETTTLAIRPIGPLPSSASLVKRKLGL
ncbi:MAG: hypothetical protein AAF828_04720 [Bacteroidota bacterium]